MILRYRIYGIDGITQREYDELIQMGIIKHKEFSQSQLAYIESQLKIAQRNDSINKDLKSIIYEDNSVGDPVYSNEGFQIQPLDKIIFGNKKVMH